MLIGYAAKQKAYKLWDDVNQKVVVSRDVLFDERASYFEPCNTPTPATDFDARSSEATDSRSANDAEEETKSENEPNVSEFFSVSTVQNDGTENFSLLQTPQSSESLRRSTRTRRAPSKWWEGPSLLMAEVPDENLSFSLATKRENKDKWVEAVNSEMRSLDKNKTWVLVPRENAANVLTSKWVFRLKELLDQNGQVRTKFKACLVTRGFQQIHGIDFEETFAPVITFSTLRLMLAIVASENLELFQMDVKTAFLNGDLPEDIYMEQPEGFIDQEKPTHVCKLQKALYGLKQAPRQWFSKINTFLCEELHFQSCAYDPCFYVLRKGGRVMIVSLYVDDLLIAGNSPQLAIEVKNALCARFEMEDCGEAKLRLGIEISRSRSARTLKIGEKNYISKILSRFKMEDCKSAPTPISNQIDEKVLKTEFFNSTTYRQAIGSLMYLMKCTRPDIAFAAVRLSQYMEKPTVGLWTCVKRVFRFIKASTHGIIFNAQNGKLTPVGFFDADWAGCKTSRKSTSGYVFLAAGGAISWKSQKQAAVATSTVEAEYKGLGIADQECVWVGKMFAFANGADRSPEVSLLIDKQGAIKMAKNDASGTRTKHIDIKYHLVRDLVSKKKINLKFCPSTEMNADMFPKPVSTQQFTKFKTSIGVGCLKNSC